MKRTVFSGAVYILNIRCFETVNLHLDVNCKQLPAN